MLVFAAFASLVEDIARYICMAPRIAQILNIAINWWRKWLNFLKKPQNKTKKIKQKNS